MIENMHENTHTKRSSEFSEKIAGLIVELTRINELSDASRLVLAKQISEVLVTNTTDSGCLVKAAEDEPIFVLRGQDRFSAALVIAWAQLHDEVYSERARERPQGMTEGQYKVAMEAPYKGTSMSVEVMACADQMARWRVRKFPGLADMGHIGEEG